MCREYSQRCTHPRRVKSVWLRYLKLGGLNTLFFLLFFNLDKTSKRSFNGHERPTNNPVVALEYGERYQSPATESYTAKRPRAPTGPQVILSASPPACRGISLRAGFGHSSKALRHLAALLLGQGCWTSGRADVPSALAYMHSLVHAPRTWNMQETSPQVPSAELCTCPTAVRTSVASWQLPGDLSE